MNLVCAMQQGFCGIPLNPYFKLDEDDLTLNLLENYLVKLQFNKDVISKTLEDFGVMVERRAKDNEELLY